MGCTDSSLAKTTSIMSGSMSSMFHPETQRQLELRGWAVDQEGQKIIRQMHPQLEIPFLTIQTLEKVQGKGCCSVLTLVDLVEAHLSTQQSAADLLQRLKENTVAEVRQGALKRMQLQTQPKRDYPKIPPKKLRTNFRQNL